MPSKTRDKLIEVARQLFIRKGVENTTISDIANASDKGRRTIYTYFKDKKEIYSAVIDRESDKIVAELRLICQSQNAPADKLRKFFEFRLSQSLVPTSAYNTLKSMLTLDFKRAELIRKKTYEKEEKLIVEILDEGIENGDFDEEKCSLLRVFLFKLIQGIDLQTTKEGYRYNDSVTSQAFCEFFVRSIER